MSEVKNKGGRPSIPEGEERLFGKRWKARVSGKWKAVSHARQMEIEAQTKQVETPIEPKAPAPEPQPLNQVIEKTPAPTTEATQPPIPEASKEVHKEAPSHKAAEALTLGEVERANGLSEIDKMLSIAESVEFTEPDVGSEGLDDLDDDDFELPPELVVLVTDMGLANLLKRLVFKGSALSDWQLDKEEKKQLRAAASKLAVNIKLSPAGQYAVATAAIMAGKIGEYTDKVKEQKNQNND